MLRRSFESDEEAAVVRNLAKEVERKCGREKSNLCSYLVDLKLFSLPGRLSNLDESSLERLVETCVNDLSKGDCLWIKILKLQVFWREKYRSKDEIKKIHHETIFRTVVPILTEIADGSPPKAVDKDDVYRKIVMFVIIFAGLGNPSQQSIIKETQAALHSIFKNTEMDNFLNLPKPTKEEQLIEFARLVTGIRLFNKDCKKGGEGIEDLPLILSEGVKATKDRLIGLKDQLDQRIDGLVKVLSFVHDLRKVAESKDDVDLSPPSGFDPEKVEELKTLLVYFRQLELCLEDLINDLDDSFVAIDDLIERFQSTLLQVHEIVRYRVAISTVQVFPLFLQLSDVWVEMQEEVDVLGEINNNYVELSSFAKTAPPTSFELSFGLSRDDAVVSDIGQIDPECSEFHSGVKLCPFSTVLGRGCLQYEGFCAWTLAQTKGVLVTGNVSIGILLYENRFYSFSSAKVAHIWAGNPDRFIKMVLDTVRRKPELVKVLNLYSELESMGRDEAKTEAEEAKKENVEVQTELHPIRCNIQRDYTFSEWELKRRAMKLATLTRCSTKSQQTVERSCFRRDAGIQVKMAADRRSDSLLGKPSRDNNGRV